MATAALLLAGCSVYRDVTGASKNDPPPDARNTQNLEAASSRPFPNLGTVPPAPARALTTAEREALQKGLLADRANARYADEELRAGTGAAAARPVPRPAPAPEQTASTPPASPAPVAATRPPPTPPAASTEPPSPPPIPAAEAPSAPRPAPASPPITAAPAPPPAAAPPAPQVAARPPQPLPAAPPPPVQQQELPRESSLTPPEVRSTPQPETPAPPPPRPAVAPLQAPPGVPPPAAVAAPPAAAPLPASRAPVVIAFAEGSAAVPSADRPRLDGLAAAARQGGTVRIVSQATPAGGGTMGQLAAFGLALDRANAVAQVLTAAGVPSERILVEAAPPADRPGRAEVSLLN